MKFEDAYTRWQERRLRQAEAAQILVVCERRFRRYIARCEDGDDATMASATLTQQ